MRKIIVIEEYEDGEVMRWEQECRTHDDGPTCVAHLLQAMRAMTYTDRTVRESVELWLEENQ